MPKKASQVFSISSGLLKKLLEKVIAFSVRFPLLVLIVFFVATALLSMKITALRFETDMDNLATKSAEAIKEIELAAREFSVWEPLYLVLTGDMRQPETWQNVSNMADSLRKITNVSRVLTPLDAVYLSLQGLNVRTNPVATSVPSTVEEIRLLRENLARSFDSYYSISPSGDAVMLRLFVRGGLGTRGKTAMDTIQKTLDAEWGKGSYYITGELFLGYSVDKTVLSDVMTLFPLAIVMVFLVTILNFRSIAGVLSPALTVISTVVATLGVMAWFDKPLTIVSAVLPVLLIAMGSADSIHIFSRYREEITRGREKREAILRSTSSMILPVVMTSLTTAAGFGSLSFSTVIPMKDFGYFSVFGILYAMFFSLFAVPALFSLLPAPRVDIAASKSLKEPLADRVLHKLSSAVARHRRVVFSISVAITIVCLLGIINIQFESNLSRYFRKGSAVSSGVRAYEDRFGGSSLLMIVVDSGKPGGVMTVDFIKALGRMELLLENFEILSKTSSFSSFISSIYTGELTQAQISLIRAGIGSGGVQGYVNGSASKAAIHTYIKNTSTREISRTLANVEKDLKAILPEGASLVLTGTPRVIQLHMESFAQSQSISLLASTLVVWFIVSLMFLSVFVGSLAMVPLFFTVIMSLGLMGLGGIPLDAATVLVASISVGIGIDYSIHFIERVKSEMKSGMTIEKAANKASRTAGHAILINAFTLVSGFAILAFSNFLTVSVFGILMTFTMATSSTAALVIIPAILNSSRLEKRVSRLLLRGSSGNTSE